MSDDLMARLRYPPFGTETTERNLMSIAANRIEELESTIKELFVLLERVEETDEGRKFHPVQITCCRALDGVKLEQVLRKLRGEKDE